LVLPVASVIREVITLMANELKMNEQEKTIQNVLAEYLTSVDRSAAPTPHLDQDTLAAFTEGSLSERVSLPVVSHLVNCSFCRHITAELVRLDLEFEAEPIAVQTTGDVSQPTKVSEVLSGLLSKMFGSSENAAFAHNEEEEKKEDERDETKD
jgi:hypothetical protein